MKSAAITKIEQHEDEIVAFQVSKQGSNALSPVSS